MGHSFFSTWMNHFLWATVQGGNYRHISTARIFLLSGFAKYGCIAEDDDKDDDDDK